MKLMRFKNSVLVLLALLAGMGFTTNVYAADSYTVTNGATIEIDEHDACRAVSNEHPSSLSIMVPTKTCGEWSSFSADFPSGVMLDYCEVPCAENWIVQTGSASANWTGITYGNGTFIAVGTGNNIMRSYDGSNWENLSTGAIYGDWLDIAYGNGTFIAVGPAAPGNDKAVMSTDDGDSWTAPSIPNGSWRSITYGDGLFVAVAYGLVATSPDGINWTSQAGIANNNWAAVTYGNGMYVAVSYDGTDRVMTSPDGVTWTARTAAQANSWRGVTYGNGLFVAVSTDGANRVMTSPDGITWTARTAADGAWKDIAYSNGLYSAVANSGTNRIMTSPDGITWTAKTASQTLSLTSIAYGKGKFVAVGNSTASVLTSECPQDITGPCLDEIVDEETMRRTPNRVWSDGNYVYTRDYNGIKAFTFNGTATELATLSGPDLYYDDIWGDGTYLYVTYANETTSQYYLTAYTFNGTSFTEVSTITGVGGFITGDGSYIYLYEAGNLRAYSFNGTSFTLLDTDTFFDFGLGLKPVVANGYIFISTDFDGVKIYSFNGTAFTLLPNSGETTPVIMAADANYYYGKSSGYSYDLVAYTYNGSALTQAGSLNTGIGADPREIWTDGTYIYTAAFVGGVRAYTFDGTSFTYIDNDTTQWAYTVYSDGNYIYTTYDDVGVAPYTFNGTDFTKLNNFDVGGRGVDLFVRGNYVFTASYNYGLHIYSFDETDLTPITDYLTPGVATGVWADNDYIYLADGEAGLHAFSFDGTNLTLITTLNTSGTAQRLWGDGQYLYLADGTAGVRAYTFNGTSFTQVGIVNTPGNAMDIWGDGTTLFIADGNTLRAYTFNGSSFTDVGSITPSPALNTYSVSGNQNGDIFITGTNANIPVMAYTHNGSSFTQTASINLPYMSNQFYSFSVVARDNFVYVANGQHFYAFVFTGDTFKTSGSSEGTLSAAYSLWVNESYTYAGTAYGVSVLRSSGCGATCPAPISTSVASLSGGYSTTGYIDNVWYQGNYLYTVAGTGGTGASGLSAYSFDGSTLTKVANTSSASSSYTDIWANDAYIFHINSSSNLVASSFNGTSFTTLATLTGFTANAVWSDGSYIYVGNTSELRAYTFNGSSFTQVGSVSASARSIWGDGAYIYVGYSNLRAYSFNGTTFTLRGTVSSGTVYDLWGDGTHIYVAAYTSGLRAYSFNGSSFTLKNTFTVSPNRFEKVYAYGPYIYAESQSNLYALTFSGTSFTQVAGPYYTTYIEGMTADKNYLFIAMDNDGLMVMPSGVCPADPVECP